MTEEVRRLVAQAGLPEPFDPVPADRLPLVVPSYGAAEIGAAIGQLLTGRLTMGPTVAATEAALAAHTGTRHAVMVNSGSSALLIMLSALVATGRLARGQEVIVPAVAWSTDLFAVAQAGLVPVLKDVDPETLCLEGSHDRPVLAVHLLGQPSQATSPLLMEDACAAQGAQVGDVRVGGRGVAGTFSFFFSHHITSGEGGCITTDDAELADAMRSLRAHGWVRERSDRAALAAQHPEADDRFLFVTPGFNVRPTEVAAALLGPQIERLDSYVAQRRANHRDWCAAIGATDLPIQVFPEATGTHHAGFGFPILLREDCPMDRAQVCEGLEARGVDTRPISGGNLAAQPVFASVPGARVEGALPVADQVHRRGLFVGNSHAFGFAQGDLLLRALRDTLQP